MNNKGFTLIELLVTITILVILSTVGTAQYKTITAKTRDSRRKSDLEQIRLALESYRSDNGAYPLTGTLPVCGGNLGTHMNDWPCDPRFTSDEYGYDGTTISYTLGSILEVGSPDGDCGAFVIGDECADADGNGSGDTCTYCVANP
jgi:prepilin-type N-terminal cleavage/methylation domain-containing protein